MKRRDLVFLQRKEDDRTIFTMEHLTWKETRVMMRSGWEVVKGETDVSR